MNSFIIDSKWLRLCGGISWNFWKDVLIFNVFYGLQLEEENFVLVEF